MKLIVGLGNPGPNYETTRHNAGFLALDLIADEIKASWEKTKHKDFVARGDFLGCKTLLLKPQTFMNLSGQAVIKVLSFYKIDLNDLIVLHDDIDMSFGSVKMRTGGGHGGHNGIRSIIQNLGGDKFHRIKLGVGRPNTGDNQVKVGQQSVSDWVLAPFSDQELLSIQNEVFDQVKVRLGELFKRS